MKAKILFKNIRLKIVRFWLWSFDKNVIRYINAKAPYDDVRCYVWCKANYIVTKSHTAYDMYTTWEMFIERLININPTA